MLLSRTALFSGGRAVLALLSAFLLASPAVSRATNVISNTGQSTEGVSDINIDGPGSLAQSFVTSSTFLGLESVTLELGDASGDPSGNPLNVSIYSSVSGGSPGQFIPGSDILDLVASNSTPTAAGSYVYTAPGGTFTVAPNTEYWIVASTDSFGDSGSYNWNFTESTSVDNPGSPDNFDAVSGWSLDTTNTTAYSGNVFDSLPDWIPSAGLPQQFYISATPVPEPATWAILAIGGGVLFALARKKERIS